MAVAKLEYTLYTVHRVPCTMYVYTRVSRYSVRTLDFDCNSYTVY